MKTSITFLVLLVTLILFSSFVKVKEINQAYHLFKIERSKDANEIFYDLNITNENKLNTENPVKIYWIKNTENGKAEPLTWIQKNYAYGIEYLKTEASFAEFQFVSYKKRQFQIKKDSNGNFKVFTTSNNKTVIVNRIFIQIDGGTFWFPKISRVELHAQDAKTKEKTIEIIIP